MNHATETEAMMLAFSRVTSLLGCLVTSYLFFRYTWCFELGYVRRGLLWGVFLAAGCIPLFISYEAEIFLGRMYPFYRYALYFVFVACLLLFCLTLATDFVLWVLSYTPWVAKVGKWAKYAGGFNIALALVCCVYALYAGMKVPAVEEVTVVSDKIKDERKIVVLSDIHIHRVINPEKVEAIVAAANAQQPDIVLLAGDIIDDDVGKVSDISVLLKGLKAKEGIYFVTGNHEFYAGYRAAVREMESMGFVFLENNGVSLGDIFVAGIPDCTAGGMLGKNADVSRAFVGADAGQFRLLMSHTPADFGKENLFDLEVSGHTHGGQIFPFHIPAKLKNKYLAGKYRMENGAEIYVTRGAGQWGPQMRLLAPSEITVLILKPEKEEK